MEAIPVLLVRDGAEHWKDLKAALEVQSLRVCEVRRFTEAAQRLKSPDPPQLVFTAVLLADGDWEGVLRLAKLADIPVIVVSTCLDARFCLEILDRGAFDFIVPPFERDDVAYLIRNACWRTAPPAVGRFPRAA